MNSINTISNAQNGNKADMDKLLKENSGLIWSVVKRFSNRGYDLQDLYQTGCIGFIKAVRRFDVRYDVKFSTYAVPLIMGEIKRFLRDDGMIKVSRKYKELAYKAAHVRENMSFELMREPTINEIADVLGVGADELAVAFDACSSWESIYKTVCESDKSEVYLIDKLARKDCGIEPTDILAVRCAFGDLKEREQKIIAMRYFMDKTQSQVAQKLGLSQVQVSRIEKKVLCELKERLN